MTSATENIAEKLFKVIKGFGHTIVLFTDDGKRTIDPAEARRFFATDLQMMVNLIVDETTKEIAVNLSKDTDISEVKPMLNSIRTLANQFILNYTVKTFGKTIGPKDFSFMAKQHTNETVARSGASDYEDTLSDNDSANRRAYKIGKQDAARGYERNAAKVGGGKRSKFYNAGFDGKPFRGTEKTNESATFNNPQVEKAYQGMRKTPKDELVRIYQRSHRVSDTEEIKRMQKSHLIMDILRDKFGDKRINETREMTRAAIMRKINDGEWEATQDVKPGKHCEIRNTTNGKKMMVMVKEEQLEEGFSGWHGSAMKSINELGDARLIVRHKRSVDEEKRGARTRQIESIFIENNEGERFKFPSNNITAAKAMVRHVKEGGTPYDDFGQYIYETMEELNQLKVFQRKNRRNDFFEDANISEEIGGRVTQLRTNLKQIAGVKGYAHHFESFTREGAEVDKEKLDELKDNVTISYFDEAISDSLPYVARVIENMRGRQAREADIVDLARYVMDNKDNIEFNSEIDETDPESPGNRKFRDPATAFAAWVTYIQSYIKDDILANKLMQAADVIHEVSGQHVKMAAVALKVVRQKGKVSEDVTLDSRDDSVYESEVDTINETMSRLSDTRHLFGA
jgi:hypothetical protein